MFRLRPVYEHDPREPLLSDILELKREEMEKQINCKYRDFQDFRYISADLQKDLADLKVNGVNNLQQKLEYGEDLPIKSELEIGRRSQSQPNIFSNNSFFPDTLKPIINKAESPTKEKKVLILDANIRENFTRENTCEFSIASDQPQFKTPRSPLQIDPRPFSTGKLETEKHPETHGKPRNPRNPQKTQKSEENPKPKYTGRPYIPRSKNIKNIGLGSRKYMNKRVVVPTKNPRRYTINRSSASPKTPKTQKPGVADAHKNIIIDTIEENNIYEKGKELEVELEVNNGNNSPGAGKTNNNNNTTRKYQHEIPAPVSILNPKPRREIIVEKIEDNSWRSRDIYGARGRYIGLMGLGRSDSDIGVGVGIGGDAEKRVILSKTGSGSCININIYINIGVKRNIGGRTRTSPKHSRYRKSQTEYIPGDIYTPTINEGAQNSNNNPNPNPKLIRMNSMEREGKVLSLTGSQYSFPSAEDLALKSQPGRTTTPKFSLRVSYGERGGGSTGGYTGGVGGTPTPILSGPKYTTGDIIPEGIIDINYTNIYTPQTVLPRVPKNTLLSSMPIAISQNIQNIHNIQNIKARAQTTRHIGGKQILENYRVQPIKRPAPPPKSLHYNLLKRSLKYRRKGAGDINKHNHNIYNKNPPPSRQAFTGTGSTSWRCRSSGAPRNIYMDDIRNSLPLTHISTRNSPLGSERISGGFDPSTLEHIDLADYPQELCTSPGAENHIIELREKLMGNTINTINTINNNNNNNIEGRAHRAHNSVITHNSGGAHNSGRAHTSINSMREHTSNPHMSHHASTPSLYSSNEMPPMYEDFLQYISSLNNTLVAKEDPVSKLVQKIRINPDGTDPGIYIYIYIYTIYIHKI